MASPNAYRADIPSAHHHYSTLPEALYSLSCLADLYEIGHVLGTENDLQELREHILTHLSQTIRAQGACLLLYHAAQQRFIPVASVGEKLPSAQLIASIDRRVVEQQALRGPGETLTTLWLDDVCIILVTLSYNHTLLGIVALSVTDKNTLVDERALLLAFMGRVAALLLRNADLTYQMRQDAINQERSRIARGLHDGITQQITHVLHKLEYIQRLLEMNAEEIILSELHYVRNTLNDVLHGLRDTMSAMLTPQVEKAKLVDTIQDIAEEYKRSHPEIELILTMTGLDESQHLSLKIEMAICQCIQEALTNVWKHARATCVHIQLHRLADWLVVEVSDNGIGFQAEQVLQVFESPNYINQEKRHFGLYMMRDRIEEAGGCWELQSKSGKGTTVRARFPLANPSETISVP
jgi:signal transduction histidine kinase